MLRRVEALDQTDWNASSAPSQTAHSQANCKMPFWTKAKNLCSLWG